MLNQKKSFNYLILPVMNRLQMKVQINFLNQMQKQTNKNNGLYFSPALALIKFSD
jgi:hypothetical protein